MKIFKIIIVFCFLYINGFSQNFAPINAEWHYSAQNGGLAPPESEYYHYVVTKDTIYEGISCRKIERTYYRYQGDSVIQEPIFVYENNDTVFYYNNSFNDFKPIYIFNISVNDTIELYVPDTTYSYGDTTFQLIVDSIEMVTIDSELLKKIYTHGLNSYYFNNHGSAYIEKLGGLDWFFPRNLLISESDGPLRCYSDSSIFVNFSAVECDYRLISKIDNINELAFNIYPNPASSKLTLAITNNQLRINNIEILDITGQKVQSIKLKGQSNRYTINVENLPTGIYFVKVQTERGTVVKKLIVN